MNQENPSSRENEKNTINERLDGILNQLEKLFKIMDAKDKVIAELRESISNVDYKCQHVKEDTLSADCIFCELAVARQRIKYLEADRDAYKSLEPMMNDLKALIEKKDEALRAADPYVRAVWDETKGTNREGTAMGAAHVLNLIEAALSLNAEAVKEDEMRSLTSEEVKAFNEQKRKTSSKMKLVEVERLVALEEIRRAAKNLEKDIQIYPNDASNTGRMVLVKFVRQLRDKLKSYEDKFGDK